MYKKRTAAFSRNQKKREEPKTLGVRQVFLDYESDDCYCPERYKYANEKFFQNVDPVLLTKDFSSYYEASDTGSIHPKYSVTTHAFTVAPKRILRPCSCVFPDSMVKKTHLSSYKNTHINNNSKYKINIPPSRPKSGLKISCNSNSAYRRRVELHCQDNNRNGNMTFPKDSNSSFELKKWFIKCNQNIEEDDSDSDDDDNDDVSVNKKKQSEYTFKHNKIVNVSKDLPEKRRRASKGSKIVNALSKSILKDRRYENDMMSKRHSELEFDQNLSERHRRALKDLKIVNARSNKSVLDHCKHENVKQRRNWSDLEYDHYLSERRRSGLNDCRILNVRSNQSFLEDYRRVEETKRKRAKLEYDHHLSHRNFRDLNDCNIINARSNVSFVENYRDEEEKMRKKQSELEYDQVRKFKHNYRRILYNEGIDDDAIRHLESFHIGPLPILMASVSDDNDFNIRSNDATRFKLIYYSKCNGGMHTQCYKADRIDGHNSMFLPKCKDQSRETMPPVLQKSSLIRLRQ